MHHYAGGKCRTGFSLKKVDFLYTSILETGITLGFLAGRSLKVNIEYFHLLVNGLDRYLHCGMCTEQFLLEKYIPFFLLKGTTLYGYNII
jgi:hypothetical protein